MIPNLEIPIAGGLNVALPKMALVRQRFDDSRLDDVGQAVGEQMQRSEIRDRVRPGMKIGVAEIVIGTHRAAYRRHSVEFD